VWSIGISSLLLFFCALFCIADVGFTPFVSSEGEADFIMSGRTLRDLSLSHRNTRTFTITPGHAATDNAATSSSSS